MSSPISPLITKFLDALAARGFRGDIAATPGERAVYATDNSIYFRLPQAAVFPRDHADVVLLMTLLGEDDFRGVHIAARGGGTGTNGQSLTDGIVVDLSRYMHRIVAIDPEKRTATVEAGVVKDQLNAALKAHGLFFAPELSTSNRATIGGMINTDASGQGSCTYGKTRHHVLALHTVLAGGETLVSEALARHDWQEKIRDKPPAQQAFYHALYRLADEHREVIANAFPPLNRSLTGYDLPHLLDENTFNINSVLCGAEGSLGIVTQATLNLLPIPKHRALVNIGYADFMAALSDARTLMARKPLSIETVDATVLALAQNDIVWQSVADYFPAEVAGINLVEFNAESEAALQDILAAFREHLKNDQSVARLSMTEAHGAQAINAVYNMRKRAVGLLGNVQGEARPQPFVEDTAVPPEHLPEFIAEFRAILDRRGLAYGMFGHVDAGVLHVRPTLDMKDPQSAEKVKDISDEVAALTRRYGGVLWGEHGKGLRSAYAPDFFGDAYPLAQQVKALFDPHNQLNPGKIATPDASALTGLTDVHLRGSRDRAIAAQDWQAFGAAMHCNGNGACFNYDFLDPMCPSWKATRDRRHSPKGRATLIKEWLMQPPPAPRLWKGKAQGLDLEVYEALHGCLSCKSCSGQCPVKVDIPDSKARFLERHHHRYRRPLRDHVIANLEHLLPRLAFAAPLYNAIQGSRPMRALHRRLLGLVDAPLFARNVELPAVNLLTSPAQLVDIEKENSIILVQDAFTRHFDTAVWRDWLLLLQALGVNVCVLPYVPSGKPLHVHGFLKRFAKTAERNRARFAEYAQSGIALVGLDPAITLIYRDEYRKDYGHAKSDRDDWHILLPQEWLAQWLAKQPPRPTSNTAPYYLAAHCMEKTQMNGSAKAWQRIFAHFGLELHEIASGCCGMSGTYGHEAEHLGLSKTLYAQSWQTPVGEHGERLLATGYSCRSQAKRVDGQTLAHPLQALLQEIYKNSDFLPS
ncbi:MAG: FAD-binding and (Fe-S)-binding domain-containing protein [Cardiobacteriaceae bacterium]|nr:FAD-binding and (Fe-S)-binding domain-containing protein [Cardiobacteriaceae bacterium]